MKIVRTYVIRDLCTYAPPLTITYPLHTCTHLMHTHDTTHCSHHCHLTHMELRTDSGCRALLPPCSQGAGLAPALLRRDIYTKGLGHFGSFLIINHSIQLKGLPLLFTVHVTLGLSLTPTFTQSHYPHTSHPHLFTPTPPTPPSTHSQLLLVSMPVVSSVTCLLDLGSTHCNNTHSGGYNIRTHTHTHTHTLEIATYTQDVTTHTEAVTTHTEAVTSHSLSASLTAWSWGEM